MFDPLYIQLDRLQKAYLFQLVRLLAQEDHLRPGRFASLYVQAYCYLRIARLR